MLLLHVADGLEKLRGFYVAVVGVQTPCQENELPLHSTVYFLPDRTTLTMPMVEGSLSGSFFRRSGALGRVH